MKCQLCNEKKGSTRCEGCEVLFCLQCMNKHHGELIQQFQQLMDIRNELKESLNTGKKTSQNENKLPCIIEIDHWEQKTIERIRAIASKARANVNEMITKNMTMIHYELEQLSTAMQQQEKEGNYLENDIEKIKLQLENLKETVQHVGENIQVLTSDNINWDKLLRIVIDEDSSKDYYNSSESLVQTKGTTKTDKQSNAKPISNRGNEEKPGFRPVVRFPFQSDESNAFRRISPPDASWNDWSNPLVNQSFTPIDRIVPTLPNQGSSSSSKLIFRKKQND